MKSDIDFWFKGNRSFSIKKSLIGLLFKLVLGTGLYIVCNTFFPQIVNINESYFKIVVGVYLIYILYKSFHDYKSLLEYLNIKSLISYAKTRREENETITILGRHFGLTERWLEQSKIKLDLLKSFTPIPLVVFISSVLVQEEWKPAGWDINMSFAFKLLGDIIDFKGIIIISTFLFTAVYILIFIETWKRHKIHLSTYYELKYEYDRLK